MGRPKEQPYRLRQYQAMMDEAMRSPISVKDLKINGDIMIAEMGTAIEAIRLLIWEAAWMLDQGMAAANKQAYLALSGAVDTTMMVTDRAVQILGGHGYIREHPVEMWMRNGRGFATFSGLAIV